jgi:hypothetical protein
MRNARSNELPDSISSPETPNQAAIGLLSIRSIQRVGTQDTMETSGACLRSIRRSHRTNMVHIISAICGGMTLKYQLSFLLRCLQNAGSLPRSFHSALGIERHNLHRIYSILELSFSPSNSYTSILYGFYDKSSCPIRPKRNAIYSRIRGLLTLYDSLTTSSIYSSLTHDQISRKLRLYFRLVIKLNNRPSFLMNRNPA